MDQHRGGKWVIHGTKHHKDNQMESLELSCRHDKKMSPRLNVIVWGLLLASAKVRYNENSLEEFTKRSETPPSVAKTQHEYPVRVKLETNYIFHKTHHWSNSSGDSADWRVAQTDFQSQPEVWWVEATYVNGEYWKYPTAWAYLSVCYNEGHWNVETSYNHPWCQWDCRLAVWNLWVFLHPDEQGVQNFVLS